MRKNICQMLGIQYPVIQGGMAWIADASLAAGVSNAGGLGIIAAGNAPADYVRNEIRKAKELTDQPFGVNVMLLSPSAEEVSLMLCEEKVAVVTTGAGNPGSYIAKWQEAGIKVIPVVPSVAIARRMERSGADALIAEGMEAGGHIGKLTTMVLVPLIADAVDIPVIAAGGIADGRGIAASLMLGASGVQVGTRFLVAHECTVHENYKKKIIGARDIDTVVTGNSTGHPVRGLRNPFAQAFAELEKHGASMEEIEAFGSGALRKSAKLGDMVNGAIMAGQSAAMVKQEQSAKEIIDEMMEGCKSILKDIDSLDVF